MPPTLERPDFPAGRVYSVGDLPLGPNDHVPDDARRTVIEQVQASIANETKRREQQASAIKKLGEDFRKERRALMGAEGYDRFRAFIREEKDRWAAATLLRPAGPRLSTREQRMRQEQHRRFVAFLRGLRLSSNQLKAQDVRMTKRLATLIAPLRKGERMGPVPPKKIPKYILSDKPNPWVEIVPPYASVGTWAWLYGDAGSEYTFSGFHYGNSYTVGTVGNHARLETWSADDSDGGVATFRSSIGFWYSVPKGAKTLDIWVFAERLYGRHYQYLATEWYGNSHANFLSENRFVTEVFGATSSQDQVLTTLWTSKQLNPPPPPNFNFNKMVTGLFDLGPIKAGPAWFLLKHPVPKPVSGDWLWIWVSSQNTAEMWVDDEVGLGFADNRWKFHKIRIESKP